MTKLTVKALSEEIGTPVDRLIEQLADAGLNKSESDQVNDEEKQTLLTHLKKNMVIHRAMLSLLVLHYNVRLVARYLFLQVAVKAKMYR